jgi:hypothetical protein
MPYFELPENDGWGDAEPPLPITLTHQKNPGGNRQPSGVSVAAT